MTSSGPNGGHAQHGSRRNPSPLETSLQLDLDQPSSGRSSISPLPAPWALIRQSPPALERPQSLGTAAAPAFAACATSASSGLDDQEAASLLRAAELRVAVHILPALVLIVIVSFLDRTNLAFAAVTMNAALGLSSTMYGACTAVGFQAWLKGIKGCAVGHAQCGSTGTPYTAFCAENCAAHGQLRPFHVWRGDCD